MGKIKDLPKQERPREKAIRFGIDKLSNEELIAILLGTGTKEVSALDLAHTIYSNSLGLVNLLNKPYEALVKVKGIGPGKALILASCFELSKRYENLLNYEVQKVNSEYLYQRYIRRVSESDKEHLIIVVLNGKKQIIHEERIYLGSEESVDCNPQEIVKNVILHKGKYFYLIHNHPSGNANPSESDRMLTTKIIITSNYLGIILLDHIIIGSNGYYSLIEDIETRNKSLIFN